MEFTNKRTVLITSYLLLWLAFQQTILTVLPRMDLVVPGKIVPFWGLEALLFIFLAAFAGAAMVQAKNYHVAWAAIAFSALFNFVQVSAGLTTFMPFFETTTGQFEALRPLASAVVAFTFMLYNAAKLLLSFAALIFGVAKMSGESKVLGGLTALVGAVAMLANAMSITFGRDSFLPSEVAGASGILATVLLALCLIIIVREEG